MLPARGVTAAARRAVLLAVWWSWFVLKESSAPFEAIRLRSTLRAQVEILDIPEIPHSSSIRNRYLLAYRVHRKIIEAYSLREDNM